MLRSKDNAVVVVSMTGKTVRDESGRTKSYEVIVENITERQSLQKQFQQAQKMEAVGRLAGGAHAGKPLAHGYLLGFQTTQLTLARCRLSSTTAKPCEFQSP